MAAIDTNKDVTLHTCTLCVPILPCTQPLYAHIRRWYIVAFHMSPDVTEKWITGRAKERLQTCTRNCGNF